MSRLPSNNFLTPERVVLSIRHRFNPTKNITADSLSNAHDEFDRGNLRNAAVMWEVIEDRDDLVKAVAGKRKKNIARNGFEVVTFPKKGTDGYEQALKQKEVLEYFYDQIVVTHAIDANERGGFKLLVRQMMARNHLETSASGLAVTTIRVREQLDWGTGCRVAAGRLQNRPARTNVPDQ